MALDRFVRWKGTRATRPSVDDVLRELIAYVNNSGSINVTNSLFTVALIGSHSHPLDEFTQRVFEVNVCDINLHIDIITRQQDNFTNAIADGFARFCARQWKGEWIPDA